MAGRATPGPQFTKKRRARQFAAYLIAARMNVGLSKPAQSREVRRRAPNYSIIAAMIRSNTPKLAWLALILLLGMPSTQALQVTGLYSERIAVTNESDGERNRAYREALESVILKVTGQRRWLDDALVRQALNNAQRYVEAISYSSETVPLDNPRPEPAEPEPNADADDPGAADEETAPPAPTTREQRYINVQFARSLIDEMLAGADIPVWDSNRPSVLVWMVLQNAAGERRMLSADSNPEIMALLRQFAARRGLPIIFPLLDFADRQNLSEDAVWSLEEDSIRAASQRYGADSVLAARVHFTASGELVGLWQFIFQDQVQTFDGFDTDLQDYLYGPLDRITTELADYFAITPEARNRQSIRLRIDGIDDLAAYAALIDYVDNLALVEAVVPVALDGTRIDLRLDLVGNAQQLYDLIALDRDLLPISAAVSEVDTRHYRWTR